MLAGTSAVPVVSAAQPISGKVHKLWGSAQISLSAKDVHVSHVGREPREASVEVHALPIPSAKPMNSEGMPEVIRTGADASLFWLQAGHSKQTAQRATSGLNRQDPLVNANEKARVWSRGRILPAVRKVAVQLPA